MAEVKINIFTCVLRASSKNGAFYAASYKVVRHQSGRECILGDEIVCERVRFHSTGFTHFDEAILCAKALKPKAPFLGGVTNSDKEEAVPDFFLFPQTMFCI